MKKTILLLFLILLFPTTAFASDTTLSSYVEPKASYVFLNTGSSINRSYYGGDCSLLDVGKGSVQIILQKQNDYNKFWYTYDGQNFIKGFSGTTVCAYSKNYTLPAGKFRCKAIITATVDGITDTRTVYSPELTIYD